MTKFSGRPLALSLGAIALLSCLNPSFVSAQPDSNLPPTFGEVTLKAGFPNDPFKKELKAGGKIKTNLGGVNAFVAKAPNFRLNYTKGGFPLTIHAKSTGDTTLLINLPNGKWVANDDGAGSLNPKVTMAKPESGRYDIYVGTFEQGVFPKATLFITELGVSVGTVPPTGGVANAPDNNLKPTYGEVTLKAGFPNDPFTKTLTAGGPIKTNLGGVNSFVAKAPDFRLNYTKGGFPLTIYAESKGDTTLLINLPNGKWVANDDGAGSLNPQIKMVQPESGRYDIYVGSFKQGVSPQATLKISELK